MNKIEWEAPAEYGSGRRWPRSAYQDFADELRAKPGEWGVVRTYEGNSNRAAYTFASTVNLARMAVWRPAGAFEGSARSSGDGKTRVHVRYVGENREHAS